MADLESLLVHVDGLGSVPEDTSGVVDEDVDARMRGIEFFGEPSGIVESGEVGDEVFSAPISCTTTAVFCVDLPTTATV